MPLSDEVQIVSVDDHVIEHPNVWQDRLPAKYREAGPKNFKDDKGNDVWELEGNRKYNIGLNAVAGKKREDFGVDPTRYADMLPGCYDPAARVKDMDVEGVTAQLCFPIRPDKSRYASYPFGTLTICVHFGSGGAPAAAPEAPFTTAIALFGLNSPKCTMDLLNTRIFERFPALKFALSEGGIGGTNIFGCFIYDDAGLHNVERIGADNIMFESDYPHSDCNWPHTRKMLAESLAHLPDDVCRKIADDNARRVFNFPRSR